MFAITVMLALAFSCVKESSLFGDSEGASLSLSIGLPQIGIDTRANSMYTDVSDKSGKIVSDPFGASLEGWQDYEKYIDGRAVYRLTMFLVDIVNHKLVGYRDFYKGSEDMVSAGYGSNGWTDGTSENGATGTRINITFDYDHPLHGDFERLERGSYQMIAVANFSPVKMEGKRMDGETFSFDYEGLKDIKGREYTEIINSIIEEFNEQYTATGAPKDLRTYKRYWEFVRFTNHAPEFLCEFKPQPLVLVRNFNLYPGRNQVSGQLHKTWARVRVVVENISNYELTINDFRFSDNLTRNKSFILYDSDNPDGSLDDTVLDDGRDSTGVKVEYGSPDTESKPNSTKVKNALVATARPCTVPALNGTGVGENNRIVLFDGYILDGDGQGKPFEYSVDLEYSGKGSKSLSMDGATVSEALFGDKPEDLKMFDDPENISGRLFAIQNQNTQKPFLGIGTNRLVGSLYEKGGDLTKPISALGGEMVFRFVPCKVGDELQTVRLAETHNGVTDERLCPIYYIQSYDKQFWVGTPRRDNAVELLPVSVGEPTGFAVMIAHKDGHEDRTYTAFRSMKENTDKNVYEYLNVYGPQENYLVSGWDDNWGGSTFWMYKVKEIYSDAKFSGDVVLKTIDPETAVVTPVTAIHRNDFINILLSVSYDERSGDIKFEVKGWNESTSDDDIVFE